MKLTSIILLFLLTMSTNKNITDIEDKKWQRKQLEINQDTKVPLRINFTVNEDNTSVYIGAKGINNFLIKSYHLNSPDIYGKTQWKVNRQNGVYLERTYLDKGNYSFTIDGGSNKPTYKFKMIVNIKQD